MNRLSVHPSGPPRVTGAANPFRSAPAWAGCGLLVFLVALALYTVTLAPTVTLVDSGELIVAARTLGVAHPPGFPLYVLLAHVATLVPVGSVAVRVNFASALLAALAVAALTAASAEMLPALDAPGGGDKRPASARRPPGPDADAGPPEALAWAPLVVPALLLAFSNTLWSYATVAEVYTLNTLLIVVIFLLMFRWRRQQLGQRATAARRSRPDDAARPLYAAAFVFGLALGVHHVTVGLTLPALAALVYGTAGSRFFRSRHMLFATLWALAGTMIYVYLPVAAARAPALDWGDPRTLQRWWWHVTGRQFQAYFALSPERVGAELAAFAALALREFGPWWLPAGLGLSGLGCGALLRRDRTVGCVLVLVIITDVAYASLYEIAEDKAAYYLPAFLAATLAAGYGARRWLQLATAARSRAARNAFVAALLLVPVVGLAANFRVNDRSRDFVAHDYVDNILDTIEPGGMLLTSDWQVCSPMFYVRSIERRRRDVVVIDVNLLRRSWYFDDLRREYPDVMERARSEIDAFLEDLRQWEQTPEAYQRSAALNERIDSRFTSMILALVRQHLGAAAVYVTQDVVLNPAAQADRLRRAIGATYQLVPQGLVFQLFADRAFHEPATAPLRTRGLADGSLTFAPDDVVRIKVFPVYVSMLYNRGRYLSLHGRQTGALQAFRQALALDPTFPPARRSLADALAAPRTTRERD